MWKRLWNCGKLVKIVVDNIVYIVYNRGMYEIFDEKGISIDLVNEDVLNMMKERGLIKANYKIYNTVTGERVK